jgi:hypothetical protein
MRITNFMLFIFFHKHGHEYLKKKHNYFFYLSKIIELKLCEYLIVAKLGGRKFVPEGDKVMTYMYLFLYLFNHTLQF